jgi:hypothetical protein
MKMKYVAARNNVTKEIRLAKRKYESNIIRRSRRNRKVFYAYVASKNRKICSKRIGPLVDHMGNTVVEDKEVATLLNDYFASVFTKNENDKFEQVDRVSPLDVISQDCFITEEEVIKTIGEFKPNKSPGIDGITSTYALKTKLLLAKPLTILFNESIKNNVIPKDWKRANISAIFKKGDKSKTENYRPVSLTSFYGKVLEKIIKKEIENLLLEAKLIKTSQHGFTKGRSCLTNLLICQDSITKMVDAAVPVDIVYLDFQKAFDKVPHVKLLEKVRETGIHENLVHWLGNWLSGRTQRVGVNGNYSEWANVYSGVPQGSILGPLLFTIFINDLDFMVLSNLLKFADDVKLWGRAETVQDRLRIQKDLDILGEWSTRNQMPFNIGKCKVMHVGKKNIKSDYKLTDQVLSKTTEEKDLGVFFSENFKPSFNCNKASKSANKIVGMIRRNIDCKSAEGMMILYKTLVRPILDYCIPVWRPHTVKDMTKLEKVQKRFTKMIDGFKGKSYEQRLSKLGITSLADRYYRADLIQVYKVLNDCEKVFPDNFLELCDRAGRKNSRKLFKRRSKLDLGKYSFTSRVVDLWNDLPDAVVRSADVNAFKGNLDYLMRGSRGRQ